MARGDLITDILEYCRNHRGEKVTLDDVRRATGYNTVQVQSVMRDLDKRHLWPVATLIGGRFWHIGLSETVVTPVVSPPPFGSTTPPAPVPEARDSGWADEPPPEPWRPTGWQATPPTPRPETTEPKVVSGQALIDSIRRDQQGITDEYGTPESTMSNWKGAKPAPDTTPTRPTRPEIIRKAVTSDQSDHLFECMGTRPGGKLLIRRDDGTLYEATLEEL